MDRRPLKTRGAQWASYSAAVLAKKGVTPNTISVLSMVFASLVLVTGYYSSESKFLLLLSALFIQLRLICNLLDGMVAVEHKKSSPNGELFNDVPDRFADIFIILGAYLAINDIDFLFSAEKLAWIGSLAAVMTAYIRVLGKSLGTKSYFIGPMAKPHRMFFLTIAFIGEFFLASTNFQGYILYFILILVALGSLVTCLRRLLLISNELKEKARE
ncbi:MAG: CDP-diacylglycerol--glycerol-3-phosphate 3-phosphatidyltransferase [Halobacteriovoraceae bacterium]|nr:CDP-diacylglycerol--glycerol-3-phosphate 3-phosphatidyltransferase [Halobacteriovoraceae bacterium]|tara:strand:- start:99 stop:743 length:645 start_codon:yes stop_codon:yes gene_type:complete